MMVMRRVYCYRLYLSELLIAEIHPNQSSVNMTGLDWDTTFLNLLTYVNDTQFGLRPKYQSVKRSVINEISDYLLLFLVNLWRECI